MEFPFTCIPATFVERPNRFLVRARLLATGESVAAHCPDPGRLTELLVPGVRVYISRASQGDRKTQFDLRFVEHPDHGQLVSLDTRIPNALASTLLHERALLPFAEFTDVHAEVVVPNSYLPDSYHGKVNSRIDFYLSNDSENGCWLEVKSVTLVDNKIALFPDAPTVRGRRHVVELGNMAELGQRCAVMFLVQRPDADRFAPNRETDPDFAAALVYAQKQGLEVYAYTCELTLEHISLAQRIPVCTH